MELNTSNGLTREMESNSDEPTTESLPESETIPESEPNSVPLETEAEPDVGNNCPPGVQKLRKETQKKLINLPLARVKQIIKLDPDVSITSAEAVVLITKAAELFIENVTHDAYTRILANKKKTIQRRDIEEVIDSADGLQFLEGTLDA